VGDSMEHNKMHFRAEFTIEEGKTEEYKELVEEMIRVVEDSEPDTINYQFYLNKSETVYRTRNIRKFRGGTCSH
jgi:hypothetical protein